MSYFNHTYHIAKFGGNIWYVNKGAGADANDGKTPDTAFETIGAGITAMGDGDALNVKAGTYTETGLDLSNDAAEIWYEGGTVLDPATGTAMTISGDYCQVRGMHKITPAAGAVGKLISGDECVVYDAKVIGGATGISITGSGSTLRDCAVGFQTSVSYDITGAQTRLTACATVGNAATIGYKINAGADTGVLRDCTSIGHQTAGYSIATGSKEWTLVDCSSGEGDGRWVDADDANAWPGFEFASHLSVHTDWSVVGGAAGTDNLFQVTGSVRVLYIYGHVETQMNADVDTLYLELDDGINQVNVTGTGLDPNSAEVGSLIIKTLAAANNLVLLQADEVRLDESSDGKKGGAGFIVTAKTGANSYIRCGWTGTGATGVIHWHVQWEPVTDEGFVVAV